MTDRIRKVSTFEKLDFIRRHRNFMRRRKYNIEHGGDGNIPFEVEN